MSPKMRPKSFGTFEKQAAVGMIMIFMMAVIMTAKDVQFKKQAKCKFKTLSMLVCFIAGHLTNLSHRTVTVQ